MRETTYRFGPFTLDAARRRLLRDGEPVVLADRHFEVLLQLAANAGHVVSKDELIQAAWKDVAVADNSIEQAVSMLRKTLGTQADGSPYIDTLARRGYRLSAPVERGKTRASDAALDALLVPYRAFVDGRAALETLDTAAIARARGAFADALDADPDYSAAHIGMANAGILAFEATRIDPVPDLDALREAVFHAREGCRLDPTSGEAWSTLAFVLHRNGETREGIAAGRKAVALDPDDWRHYLRLASVSWGEERLRAAHRVRLLCPDLALAHWLAATVFVARQAFDAALEDLRAGCASQDAQEHQSGRFKAVGLHLLHGLVLAARNDDGAAIDEFTRELEFEDDGQVYARECAANTWYSIGAIRYRQGRIDAAQTAFRESLTRAARHPLAAAALAAVSGQPAAAISAASGVDAAMALSISLVMNGNHEEAARVCAEALADADSAGAGWTIVVDPLLNPCSRRTIWARTLAIVRDRAR